MRALVIGDEQRRQITELKAVAAANPMDPVASKAAASRDMDAYRDMMKTLSIELPIGYVVTYTHEIQSKLCHHISISVDRPNKMPSPTAVDVILNEFGMRPKEESQGLWVETIDATTKAINIVQFIE